MKFVHFLALVIVAAIMPMAHADDSNAQKPGVHGKVKKDNDASPFDNVLLRKKSLSLGKENIRAIDLSDLSFMDVQIMPLPSAGADQSLEVSVVSDMDNRTQLGVLLDPIQVEIVDGVAKLSRKNETMNFYSCSSSRSSFSFFGMGSESLSVSGACYYKVLVFVADEDVEIIKK